jgi:hypothetical protein
MASIWLLAVTNTEPSGSSLKKAKRQTPAGQSTGSANGSSYQRETIPIMTNFTDSGTPRCQIAAYPDGYQQALDDFGITELLEKLSNFSDADFDSQRLHLEPEELDSIAAILIQQLIDRLNGKLIGSYLNAIRRGSAEGLSSPISLEFPQSASLPADFPDCAPTPRFGYGEKVRWVPIGDGSEWGAIVGRFYNYASHRCCWMWRYIVWLDRASLSAAWVAVTTAWEDDLAPYAPREEA